MTQTKETIWKGAYVPEIGLIDLKPASGLVNKFVHEYDCDEERYMYDSKGEPIGKHVQVMQDPLLNTQEAFIPFFNERLERMIDASDLYRIGKPGISSELLGSIRKSFGSSGPVVTSTSCLGKPNSLYGGIIHNKGSTVVTPTEVQLLIPNYNHTSLDKVLRTEEGLTFSRGLFETEDSAETIVETLERLTQYKSKDIVFYTNSQKDREKHPELKVRFHPTSCSEEYVHDRKWFFIGNFGTAMDWYSGGIQGGTSRGIKLHKQ